MSEQLLKTPCTFGENGNFLLERELGTGGMGGVYMGRDKMLDRPVAVKVMQKEYGADPEFVEKFKKEAQSAARLIHPNIAQIYSYGIADGMPYIAMELVAGGSLFQILKNSGANADVTRVIKICQQIAQALQCASDLGCVHGDVKPENILLDANGNAKLVDFGLAGMQKDTDEIWGTPYYIAPEKVKKEPVDFRADMYSLGCTLYHVLTGTAPFEGEDPVAVVKKRFAGMPAKPSEIRPSLTPEIDELVMQMIAFDRNDRFPSFEALLAAFTSVLTSGLGTTGKFKPVSAPAAPAAATGSGRRTVTMTRRRMKVRKTGAAEGDGEGAASGAKSKTMGMKAPQNLATGEEDEEESGGSVGGKVALVIGGIVLVVGLLGGGLAYYVHHDKEVRAAEHQAQISKGIEQARASIAKTRGLAVKFADEFAAFAGKAEVMCAKSTRELAEILPDFADQMKPAPTKELLDAIASTNQAAQTAAAAQAPAAPGATAPTVTPAPTPASAPAKASGWKPFRAPVDDEADPNSPEGAKYLAEKKAYEEAQRKNAQTAATDKPSAEGAASGDAPKAAPPVVASVNELWVRVYTCQACTIRIGAAVAKVVARCDEAQKVTGETEADLRTLEGIANEVIESYEGVKVSPDVEAVRKAIGYISSRGQKFIDQTKNELRIKALEEKRAAEKAAREEADKKRKEEQAAARAQLVETETAGAKAKFDALVAAGNFKVLDWAGAERLLKTYRGECQTPEGQIATDLELEKVASMRAVHEIFIRNLKGYTFKRFKLRKCTVREVNAQQIKLVLPDGKKTRNLSWQKFYTEHHGEMNDLIITYVENGRENGTPKLTLKGWCEAMFGVALTMRIVCSDDPAATVRGEEIAKKAVEKFPDRLPHAKQFFPDINFNALPSDE